MEKSPAIENIAKALASFQSDMESVSKDAENPFFHSKYATLENIISTAKAHLKKHGLSFAQFPDGDGLTTIIMHTSGEFIQATCRMTPKDETPQSQGSAITYMRRYALSAALGIATDEDDDGNAASAPKAAKSAARSAPKPAAVKDPAKAQLAAKDRILALLKQLERPCSTKKECEDAVFDLTGLQLTPDNYEAIGEALAERLEAKNA
jgi:hypothetical protein